MMQRPRASLPTPRGSYRWEELAREVARADGRWVEVWHDPDAKRSGGRTYYAREHLERYGLKVQVASLLGGRGERNWAGWKTFARLVKES